LAGIIDGRTVGTCTLSVATETAALYFIATDPAYRRRGVATALTQAALDIAKRIGMRLATLQASAVGEAVYRRIGFRTVTTYRHLQVPT
uniref:GNAT family N-acetyltransferase n=1 Tax=Actinoplanes solisilvae TaxID=2486853 RepID=UPI0013E3AA10